MDANHGQAMVCQWCDHGLTTRSTMDVNYVNETKLTMVDHGEADWWKETRSIIKSINNG